MLRLFLPLALSSLLMGACSLVVAAGVARLPAAATALAALGVVSALAILVESPIIAILSTSVALSETRAAARLVWRFMVGLGLGLTGIMLLALAPPVYDPLAGGLLGLPAPVAAAAAPALHLMVLWPFAIGWRRYYQGLLIRQGRAAVIGWGTAGRLAATAVAVFLVGPALGLPGATAGALALVTGAVAEAAIVTPAGRRAERRLPAGPSALTLGEIWRYHRPLAATHLMRVAVQPLISAALARGALATLSLAAWPLVSSTALLLSSATVPLQEVAIATVKDDAGARRLRRFTWQVGLMLTLALGLVAATPLLDGYLTVVLGAPEEVRAVAAGAMVWLLPAPLLLAWQSARRGLLAARRRTGPVGWAMAVNLAVLAGWLTIWVWLGLGPGVAGAATGLVAATAVELVVLSGLGARASRPAVPAARRGPVATVGPAGGDATPARRD
jgi:Na+-driven multidrug efflux pump